jgi:hypothetical protein
MMRLLLNWKSPRRDTKTAVHKKAPQIAGLFHKTSANLLAKPADYMAFTWLLSLDLCRAALFLGMMPFATERSIAGTAAL